MYLRFESDAAVPQEVEYQLKTQLAWIAMKKYLEQVPEYQRIELEYFDTSPNLEATIDAVDLRDEAANQQATDDSQPTDEQPQELANEPQPAIRMLQRPSDDAVMIAFNARTTTIPIRDVLSQLAATSELKFELDSNAASMVRGRSTKLDVTGVSLALLLDNLVKPLGLSWSQTDNIIRFVDVRSIPDLERFYLESAIRAQRVLALDNGPHERRSAAILALGNLYLISQDYEQASLFYQQLQQLKPER